MRFKRWYCSDEDDIYSSYMMQLVFKTLGGNKIVSDPSSINITEVLSNLYDHFDPSSHLINIFVVNDTITVHPNINFFVWCGLFSKRVQRSATYLSEYLWYLNVDFLIWRARRPVYYSFFYFKNLRYYIVYSTPCIFEKSRCEETF